MTGLAALRQPLRLLLLPMRAGVEATCAAALGDFLAASGVDAADHLDWVSLELGRWEESGCLSKSLAGAITAILAAADEAMGEKLGDCFPRLYAKLRAEHFMEHEEARAFLSHAFLIIDLAQSEMLSAAQLAKLLTQRDSRVRFSRQSIADMLDILGLAPSLSQTTVKALVERDRAEELPRFADADVPSAAESVAEEGRRLGFPGDLAAALGRLHADRATPYLQILHYQCCIAEYYDHAVTDLYEFSPRGQVASWLFEQYPHSMADAGNPFLNNAKSVERLDRSWVRSKKVAERPGAAMLVDILGGLEAMGFAARRELARLIRLWLHRVMRLSQPSAVPLPATLDRGQWKKLLDFVAGGNTATFGILEQRVVDAVAAFRHPDGAGWRSRGLGASVNATNISQRKVGDCDFQHPVTCALHAYEAHGGALSPIYVHEHLRTVGKTMPARARELAGIADLAKWRGTLTFVAHTVAADVPHAAVAIAGVPLALEYHTYRQVIDAAWQDGIAADHLDRLVLAPLGEARTPAEVRRVITGAIA